MAYVPGYEHDIFISYAHVDNEPEVDSREGWVSILKDMLETRLAQLLGRKDAFSIWQDEDLARNVDFSGQIATAIEKTATFPEKPGALVGRKRDSRRQLVGQRT